MVNFFEIARKGIKDIFGTTPTSTMGTGTSGTEIFSGMFDEEYLMALFDSEGIKLFDKMRRSDDQVAMLLDVVKNPIRSANWSFESVDDSDEEKEVAEFMQFILFEDMGYMDGTKFKTWQDLLDEMLTCIEFGFSVFEPVHKIVMDHPVWGNYLGLADIAFRHQRSILEWHLYRNGGIREIRQLVNGDLEADVVIPGNKIMVFTLNKEGDNYQGISMLRPLYGNYFRKNIYRKLQAIGIERGSRGALIGSLPVEMLNRPDAEVQRQNLQDLLNKLTGHEVNAITKFGDIDIDQVKINHDAEKVQKVINSENTGMSKRFLANFMELGLEGSGGSYSLGSDLSDIFLGGIECIAKKFQEPIQRCVVKKLVNAKFGIRDKYPRLVFKGINDKAGEELATVLEKLSKEDLIQKSPRMKEHIHKTFDFPQFDEKFEAEQEAKAEEDKKREIENAQNNNNPEPPEEPDPDIQPKDKGKKTAPGKTKKKIKASDPACCSGFDEKYAELKETVLSQMGKNPETEFERYLFEYKIYEYASKVLNLAELLPSVFIKVHSERLAIELRASLTERSDALIKDIVSIVRRLGFTSTARTKALNKHLPDSASFRRALKSFVGDVAAKAMRKVLKELGKPGLKLQDDFKDLPKGAQERFLAEILLTSGALDADVEKVVFFTFNQNFDRFDSPAELNKALIESRDKFIAQRNIDTVAVNMTSKVTNGMRDEVFKVEEVLEDIETFVFTNPDPISAICTNLNGRVFSKEEYLNTPFLPPLHHNCKSFIVAQTQGKKSNKPLDPEGLEPVGTKEQIARALKSKTL